MRRRNRIQVHFREDHLQIIAMVAAECTLITVLAHRHPAQHEDFAADRLHKLEDVGKLVMQVVPETNFHIYIKFKTFKFKII